MPNSVRHLETRRQLFPRGTCLIGTVGACQVLSRADHGVDRSVLGGSLAFLSASDAFCENDMVFATAMPIADGFLRYPGSNPSGLLLSGSRLTLGMGANTTMFKATKPNPIPMKTKRDSIYAEIPK